MPWTVLTWAMLLRARYAIFSTDAGYAATRSSAERRRRLREPGTVPLWSYALVVPRPPRILRT
eukprot:1788899-Rhodomonas_salina.3